jgi:hypothetical protein
LADVTEPHDACLVERDLPAPKDGAVEIAGNERHITGEIVEMEKVGWLRHRTRRVGQFRCATVPGHIDAEQISADLADGVLTVRAPTSGSTAQNSQPRRARAGPTVNGPPQRGGRRPDAGAGWSVRRSRRPFGPAEDTGPLVIAPRQQT